jgi:uncharacterized protein YyaL (SSP411 family)
VNRSLPTNRLAGESSPYLRLHAHNPVDWYPWGAEAIARARAEDKPIFLSVGYSTCYWCHVMERESFSDPGVAAEMNRHFVNVKVDREERPDLDEVYMLATQILAGQGGWPNSVFLTPRLEPFFAGTYFPPADAHGRPGFPTVLRSMVHAWRERRDEVEEQAAELAASIRRHLDEIEPEPGPLPGAELAIQALDGLRRRFDPTWGGFGQQPKFPTPSNLWLLFSFLDAARPAGGGDTGGAERRVSPESRERRVGAEMMLATTLDAMARGGVCDQLAGGFHRYSTDREWRVPHFEKMLYDNGLLLELYAREHARTGRPEPARVALATADWLAREMTSPEGAFWSAVDAETAGHEGAYYVWTRSELDAVLGREDAEFLAPLYGFDGEPFFEGGAYVLHLPRPLDVQAAQRRTSREALIGEIEPLAAKLLDARARRPRPATDDKLLADWNGTAIAGLAVAGRLLARPDLVDRAARAADFLLAALRAADGTLLHAWRAGEGRIAAFLSDYVFLVRGLLRLHAATGDGRWLDEARRLTAEQTRRLASPRGGFFNAAEADDLLIRGKELFDGAMPAANGVAALNLLELASATGEATYLDQAEHTLRAFAPLVVTHPDGARTLTIAFAAVERHRTKTEASNEGKDEVQPCGALEVAPVAGAAAGVGLPQASAPAPASAGEGDEPGWATEPSGPAPASPPPSTEGLSREGATVLLDPRLEIGSDELPGGWREFVLRFKVKSGWHLAVEGDLPRLAGVGVELDRVEWPSALPLPGDAGGRAAPAFTGRVGVHGLLRGATAEAAVVVRYVACGDGRCLPPAELAVPLP